MFTWIRFDTLGSDRKIAEAAWTSSQSRLKMQVKTDSDVDRVVRQLIRDHHTSPLEQAVIQFEIPGNTLYPYDTVDRLRSYRFLAVSRLKNACGVIVTMNLHALMNLRGKEQVFWDAWRYISELEQFKSVTDEVNNPGVAIIGQPSRQAPQIEATIAEEGLDQIKVELNGVLGNKALLDRIMDGDNDKQQHCNIQFWCHWPIFTDRQFIRYRQQSPNGLSARYRTLPSEYMKPPSDILDIANRLEGAKWFSGGWQSQMEQQYSYYESELYRAKVAESAGRISNAEYKRFREFVRGCLGTAYMVDLVTTLDLASFQHICDQRLKPAAQPEIKDAVGKMKRLIQYQTDLPIKE